VAEAVKLLVAGLPAEILREIGLRIRGASVTEFENAQQMGRAAARGEAQLVVLSDTLPTVDSIYIARRAKDSSDDVKIVFIISMAQAEAALHALKELDVDRFFFAPVDIEEMLRELAKMVKAEVLPPQASHGENIAAAVADAWDRARASVLKKVDALDDAAIALLDNALSPELKKSAASESQSLSDLAARFGFERGSRIAREVADKISAESLTPVDGVAISEQLLALRSALEGRPQLPSEPKSTPEAALATSRPGGALDESAIEGAKVLVVDDDVQISRALTTMLGRRKINVVAINDPFQFWGALEETKPKLILLDLEMPKISGTELCRVVRNDRRWNEISVIFLTGHTDPDSVRRVFAAGADDYVGKPFVPAELMTRIESRLGGAKARRGPTDTDAVTGLPTADKTVELVNRFLRLARRKSDPYSIGVMEVDDFSRLAETYGRSIGDRVLRTVGELLPKSFRGEDIVGWWGGAGAEFLVGMYGSSKEHAAIKLNQVCLRVGEQKFLTDDGRGVRVQCSAGVSQYQIDGETVGALRDKASEVLQEVRQIGLNRVGISGVQLPGPMTRRVDVVVILDDPALVSLLQHAMESRNLRVATFGDGETAVAALTSDPPEVQASLILLGVDLPALNGLDVLRRLKSVEVTRTSGVVMLTARTGERDVLAALELGAIDHIAKPFSVPVLMHKVRTILRQSS
jgi:diguanylate cyclase (GGDEF)-like protein